MNKHIKTEFLIDKFTDYTGKEREFIIAAVSVPLLNDTSFTFEVPDVESFDSTTGRYENDFLNGAEKVLFIGWSVRHPDDKYDVEIGKRIAMGKALKNKGTSLVVGTSGLINTKMVKALLEQEAEYFKRNPQSYIAGYRKAENRWKNQSIKNGLLSAYVS